MGLQRPLLDATSYQQCPGHLPHPSSVSVTVYRSTEHGHSSEATGCHEFCVYKNKALLTPSREHLVITRWSFNQYPEGNVRKYTGTTEIKSVFSNSLPSTSQPQQMSRFPVLLQPLYPPPGV